MTKKKKRLLIISLVIVVLSGWLYYKWNYTGSRSGKVVDAITGEPIQGAVVCMYWETSGFMEVAGGDCGAIYETKTDEKGRYAIPSQRYGRSFLFEVPYHENVMIYKDGYCGYKAGFLNLKPVGRSFGHKEEEQPYRKKKNKVRLFPFKKSDSHTEHLRWIHSFGIYGWPQQLLEKELHNEMEREREER